MNTNAVVEKKFLIPFILITSLFFLWGIANDLTNPMVLAFKKVMPRLTNVQSAMVQFAFYGGYATMALPAALFIRKYTYKWGIILGLSLYSIGALLFYPATTLKDYNFYLLSLYVLTFGLAFLETTSNPYILSMGSVSTATRRLNLSQTFNPIGSLTGMLMAQLLVIGALRSSGYTKNELLAMPQAVQEQIQSADLATISWPYIALGLLVLLMLIIIVFVKMPKRLSTVEQLPLSTTFKKLMANKRYCEGVITQVFYVGAQIMCWTFIYQYVDHLNSVRPANAQLTAVWYNMAAMILFLIGRAGATFAMKYIIAAKLMFYYAIAGVLFTAGAIILPGIAGLYSLILVSFAMSLMFPTIYGVALRNMGEEAKIGSAGLVMAIVGGALLPLIQASIIDIGGGGFADRLFMGYIPEVNISFILPLICLSIVAIYSYRSFKIHLK